MDHTSHAFLPAQHTFYIQPGLTEEFDLHCAVSVVIVLGYVLLFYGTFKELSPLWGVFEKQPNFCHTVKHVLISLTSLQEWHRARFKAWLLHWKYLACNAEFWNNPWCDHQSWLLHHMFETLYCSSWATGFWDFVEYPHIGLLQ